VTKAVVVVISQPSSPEREDEYNQWYDERHLPEVCDVPGFTGARRFKLADNGLMPLDASAPQYLAIYEMDCDDPVGALSEMATRAGDGRIFMSDAICMDPVPEMYLYLQRD
jgi:hypothetical protein